MSVAIWLGCIAAPALTVVALGRLGVRTERLRNLAVAGAALSLIAAAAVLFVPALAAARVPWPGQGHPLLGASIIRVNGLSAPLVPLPSALWLITIAVTPRSRLDRDGLIRTALATASTTLAFLTESPALLVVLWTLTTALFLRALSPDKHRRARRAAAVYLSASTVILAAGVGLAPVSAPLGLGLVAVAVLIRKGIFPFHAWIPEAFDTGRLGPVLLFCAPQLGAYVAAVLIVPHAGPLTLRVIATLSLVTAVYGAALALVQRDARRACGYLFVSQSALVLAGLDSTSVEALAGSLVLWISSALAFTGMARTVLALEARRGRLDLTRYHGGYERMPLLAASFLVLGLACTGFPGTLGFVGEEMLIQGAVHGFTALGFLVVGASALTGLAVLRMYFSLFCGRRSRAPELGLRRRESIVFAAIAAALVIAGLIPQPIVSSRLLAGEQMMADRADDGSVSATGRSTR